MSALEGNLESLGIVADHLLFDNQSSLCSLLVAFVTGKYFFEESDETSYEMSKKLKNKFKFELDRYENEINN